MSRIGRMPIPVPSGVKADIAGDAITITGPKGTMRGAPAKAHSSSNKCFCTAVQPGPPNWVGQP